MFWAFLFVSGRRCQIFSHYIIPHSFCQVKRLFKFFFLSIFLSIVKFVRRRPGVKFCTLSNFDKPATNQLRLSNFESAAKSATKQFLYIYISPFIITQILKLIKLQKLSNFYAQILNVSNFDF